MSAANPLSQSNNDESEVPAPASEPSRPTEPRRHPAPMRNAFDTELGLESGFDSDSGSGSGSGPEGFDFHDTIPAPPWLDDAPDTVEAPLVPSR